MLAVKDAAEQSRSPVILGFNGGFLENAERNVAENLHHYGALGAVVARQAAVPMALILNEAKEEDSLYTGLGISKVNVGSVLRRAYVNALQEFIRNNEISRIDPGSLTSTGGSQDMLYRARMAVKDEVIRLMELLGSAGKIS